MQTVLNRLTERGMVKRRKVGNAFEYQPSITEDEYLSRTISDTLAGASSDARRAVLARLIGHLDAGELTQLQDLAKDIGRRRRST